MRPAIALWAALQVTGLGASPSASPERLAASRAEADALIARASVADLFEDVTSGVHLELRHKASGYVCGFDPGRPNAVMVYPGLPRGDDVQCRARMAQALVDTFITRPARPVTLQQAFAGYMAEVRQKHPDAAPYVGRFAEAGVTGAPPRLTARMTYQQNGRAVFSRLSVAVVNGWVLEQRLDAPPGQAFASDLLGDVVFVNAAARMASQGVAQPAAGAAA